MLGVPECGSRRQRDRRSHRRSLASVHRSRGHHGRNPQQIGRGVAVLSRQQPLAFRRGEGAALSSRGYADHLTKSVCTPPHLSASHLGRNYGSFISTRLSESAHGRFVREPKSAEAATWCWGRRSTATLVRTKGSRLIVGTEQLGFCFRLPCLLLLTDRGIRFRE